MTQLFILPNRTNRFHFYSIIFLFAVFIVNTAWSQDKLPTPQEGLDSLKEEVSKLGKELKVNGTAIINGKKVPALYVDQTRLNLNYKAVDAVSEKFNKNPKVTATLFVKDGDNFIRVSTSVKKDDGTRAVGTELAKNDAYKSVMKGEKFCGKVTILELPYDTCYEPIKINNEVVGIYYFGIKQ